MEARLIVKDFENIIYTKITPLCYKICKGIRTVFDIDIETCV